MKSSVHCASLASEDSGDILMMRNLVQIDRKDDRTRNVTGVEGLIKSNNNQAPQHNLKVLIISLHWSLLNRLNC